MNLLDDEKTMKWRDALRAVDGLRDRYGESAVSLANGIPAAFRERTHESLVQKASQKAKGQKSKVKSDVAPLASAKVSRSSPPHLLPFDFCLLPFDLPFL